MHVSKLDLLGQHGPASSRKPRLFIFGVWPGLISVPPTIVGWNTFIALLITVSSKVLTTFIKRCDQKVVLILGKQRVIAAAGRAK